MVEILYCYKTGKGSQIKSKTNINKIVLLAEQVVGNDVVWQKFKASRASQRS